MYKLKNSIKTIEQYNKKYKHLKTNLVVLTKKEVEEFDLLNNCKGEKRLLDYKTWALIKDSYYEIPKPVRWTWFRNLNAGVQAATSVLLIGAVGAAVAVPTYMMLKKDGGGLISKKIILDSKYSNVVESKVIIDSLGNASGKLVLKDADNNDFEGVEIKIGSSQLKEDEFSFDVDTGDLLIKAEVLNKYTGDVVLAPVIANTPGSEVSLAEFQNNIKEVCDLTAELNYKCTVKSIETSPEANSQNISNYFVDVVVDDEGQITQKYKNDYIDDTYYFTYGDGNNYVVEYDYFTEQYSWDDYDDDLETVNLFYMLKQSNTHFSDFTFENNVYKGRFECYINDYETADTNFELKFNSNKELIKAIINYEYEGSYEVSCTDYLKFGDYNQTEIELPIEDMPLKKIVASLNNYELDINDTNGVQLTTTFKGEDIYNELTVELEPSDVVTIDENAVVKPVSTSNGGKVEIGLSGEGYEDKKVSVEVANYNNLDFLKDEYSGVKVSLKSGDTSTSVIIPSCKYFAGEEDPLDINQLYTGTFSDSTTLTKAVMSDNIHYIEKGTFGGTQFVEAVMDSTNLNDWYTYDDHYEVIQSINSTDIESPTELAALIKGQSTKYSNDYKYIANW